MSEDERQRYIAYIDEEYNADRLTQILTDVAEIVADALGLGVRVDERLGGGCDPETVDAILADAGNPRRPSSASRKLPTNPVPPVTRIILLVLRAWLIVLSC